MEKKIKLQTKLIENALVDWSPKGLCEGSLVAENGKKEKTQACAIGCLALDFAYSPEGKTFFKEHKIPAKGVKKYLSERLYGIAFLTGDFAEAVRAHYGLTPEIEGAIMNFNDSCIDNKGKISREEHKKVPVSLRKTIYSLRQRHEKWLEEQYGVDDEE